MATPENPHQEQKGSRGITLRIPRRKEATPPQHAVSEEIDQILQPIEEYVHSWVAKQYPPPIQHRSFSQRAINMVTGESDIMEVRLREINGQTLCQSISLFDNSVQFDEQGHMIRIVARGGAIHVNIQDPRKMRIIDRTAFFAERFKLDENGLTRFGNGHDFAREVGNYARDALSEFLPEKLR